MSSAETTPPMSEHPAQLDAVKTAAILMVVAFHSFGQLSGWQMRVVPTRWFESYLDQLDGERAARFAAAYLYLGVNLFIIASGFGLYYSHLKRGGPFEWASFWKARIARLFPAAAFSVALAFLVKGLLLDGYPVDHPLRNLYPFLAGFNTLSDQWFFPPINGDTWFIGLILQLYLVFPLMVALLARLGEARFLLATVTVSVAFRAAYYIDVQYVVSSMSYGFFLGRIFEFSFGMVAARRSFGGGLPSTWWALGLGVFWGYFYPFGFPFADPPDRRRPLHGALARRQDAWFRRGGALLPVPAELHDFLGMVQLSWKRGNKRWGGCG